MARAMRYLWLPISRFIAHSYLFIPMQQKPSLTADDHCNRCLAKRDQSATMLSPNYFFIFGILIKNSQKMVYVMNTLHIE